MSLRALILTAYQIQPYQLVGAPSWTRTDYFDIVARATGELTTGGANPTLPGALRALIEERFQLVAHTELRQLPVYALRMMRVGQLGPNLSPSTIDCATIRLDERVGRGIDCRVSPPGAPDRYFAGSRPMSALAAALGPYVGRPVVDQTGLDGNFKIDLTWTPVESLVALSAGQPFVEPPEPNGGGSIFTALQEQLGLRLEATVAPVSVVVIDSIHNLLPD